MATLLTDTAFNPIVGKCYEVHFGKITLNEQTGFCIAKIKVEGAGTAQWVDLDTGCALDQRIAVHVVQAYMEVPCP